MKKSPYLKPSSNSPIIHKPSKAKSTSAVNKALKEHLSSLNLIKKLNDLTNMKTAKKHFSPSGEAKNRSGLDHTAQKAKSAIEGKKKFFSSKPPESKKKKQLMEILSGTIPYSQMNEIKPASKISSSRKSKSKSHERKSKIPFDHGSKYHGSSKKQSLNQIFSNMRTILNDIPRKSAQVLPRNPFSPSINLQKKHRSVDPNLHDLQNMAIDNSWNNEEISRAIEKIKECGHGSEVIDKLTNFMYKVLDEMNEKKKGYSILEQEKSQFFKEKSTFDKEICRLRDETHKFEKVLESSFKVMKKQKESEENHSLKKELKKQKMLIRALQKEIKAIKAKAEVKEEEYADESRKS